MRYAIVLGAAALVAASPAPQAFDPAALDTVATLTQGPPVGVGPAQQTAYEQSAAQVAAAAAVTGAATAQAKVKRDADDLEKRTFWWLWNKYNNNPAPKPSVTSTTSAAQQTAPPTTASAVAGSQTTKAPSTTDGIVPSSCTPVSWTNTFAFTSDPACATAIEVGTYCGFINPEDPCAPQPAGAGTPPKDDTVDGFYNNPDYDVASCSKFCDETSTCTGFNIFIERDPKWNPDQCSCTNPPSIINYKCSIWGQNVSKDTATNTGSTRDDFKVVITGSNGYNKATYTSYSSFLQQAPELR
ncbi:hypothetical protein N0V86_001643 [Didymella sp. IMI 355093]|nr:hypothetical protein N0V86_001643 [Didymella sp. IMI 355093]